MRAVALVTVNWWPESKEGRYRVAVWLSYDYWCPPSVRRFVGEGPKQTAKYLGELALLNLENELRIHLGPDVDHDDTGWKSTAWSSGRRRWARRLMLWERDE